MAKARKKRTTSRRKREQRELTDEEFEAQLIAAGVPIYKPSAEEREKREAAIRQGGSPLIPASFDVTEARKLIDRSARPQQHQHEQPKAVEPPIALTPAAWAEAELAKMEADKQIPTNHNSFTRTSLLDNLVIRMKAAHDRGEVTTAMNRDGVDQLLRTKRIWPRPQTRRSP